MRTAAANTKANMPLPASAQLTAISGASVLNPRVRGDQDQVPGSESHERCQAAERKALLLRDQGHCEQACPDHHTCQQGIRQDVRNEEHHDSVSGHRQAPWLVTSSRLPRPLRS